MNAFFSEQIAVDFAAKWIAGGTRATWIAF